jgi:3-keto-L-gulonate-6-phosphate decarboxylase
MNPKLQVAIDTLSPSEAVDLVAQIQSFVDVVEAGTPFLKRYGLAALRVSDSFSRARCLLPT